MLPSFNRRCLYWWTIECIPIGARTVQSRPMPVSISTRTTPSYNAHPALPHKDSPPVHIYHAFGGAATLSGTSGFTSVTTLNNSSITLSPVLLPASLIFFSCSSASLSASSSAFLLPLVCCQRQTYQSMLSTNSCCDLGETGASHLLLKFFEFIVFLLSVFFNLFLSFALGVFDSFGTVWKRWLGGGEVAMGEKGLVHSRAKKGQLL